jgi:phenylpyruvate tautomerase PptA (4-oxalocrotonate tautomerase family)
MRGSGVAAILRRATGSGDQETMPIVDIEVVCDDEAALRDLSAKSLADALAKVFRSPPGRTWVRLRWLSPAAYAENDTTPKPDAWPVFVSVLKAHPPAGDALASEVRALTDTVAVETGRAASYVHVTYAPAAVGRQAFGGEVVA